MNIVRFTTALLLLATARSRRSRWCNGGPGARGSCLDSNELCSRQTGGVCFCKRGYIFNDDDRFCVIRPRKVGGSCKAVEGSNPRGTCLDHRAVCLPDNSGGKCVCKAGTGIEGGDCVSSENDVSGTCTPGANTRGSCKEPNAECLKRRQICQCRSGYSAWGSKCVVFNKIGGVCTGGPAKQGTCEDPRAVCSAQTAGVCGCADGFGGPVGGECDQNRTSGLHICMTSLGLTGIVGLMMWA